MIRTAADIDASWQYAAEGARGTAQAVIVEGFVDFDYEITLLTIRHRNGTTFCAVGHRQEGGRLSESWQPQAMLRNNSSRQSANRRKGNRCPRWMGPFWGGVFCQRR